MKPKPHQLNKIEAEQKNDQKQDVMEFEDRAYLDARGVTLDNYITAEVLAKFRARPNDKSEVLDKLEDILACNKIEEGEKWLEHSKEGSLWSLAGRGGSEERRRLSLRGTARWSPSTTTPTRPQLTR